MKNKLIKLLIGEVGLLLLFSAIIFVVNLLPTKISEEIGGTNKLIFPKLSESQFVKSDFVASNNYLNRVDVLFKNPNLESRDELKIVVKRANQVIVEKSFTGFNFGDTSHARIDFEPISSSKGVTFTVEVKTTKIVDGKLAVGMKGEILDTTLYYSPRFSIVDTFGNMILIFEKIISKQAFVLVLPMSLLGILLW